MTQPSISAINLDEQAQAALLRVRFPAATDADIIAIQALTALTVNMHELVQAYPELMGLADNHTAHILALIEVLHAQRPDRFPETEIFVRHVRAEIHNDATLFSQEMH